MVNCPVANGEIAIPDIGELQRRSSCKSLYFSFSIKPWFKLHWMNYFTSLLKSFPSSIFRVSVHFVSQDGSKYTANAKVGDNLLDVVVDNDIDIDGFG